MNPKNYVVSEVGSKKKTKRRPELCNLTRNQKRALGLSKGENKK